MNKFVFYIGNSVKNLKEGEEYPINGACVT